VSRLPQSSVDLQIYREVIDVIPTGIVVLCADATRRLVMRNAAAATICDGGKEIILTQRTLRLRDPAHDEWLRTTISDRKQSVLEINIDTRQIAVATVPLAPQLGKHYSAVLITAAARQGLPPVAVLRKSWGLTAAESELVRAFAETGSIRAAADVRGITEGTARQYLKRIYNKVDVKGQAHLIRRLMLVTG